MDFETRAKIENLIQSYENKVLVSVTLIALSVFFAASIFTICFFTREAYEPARGDQPLITYQVVYNGQSFTQVAAWVDQDNNSHYAKEPARLAGIDVRILVIALFGLGIGKGAYDLYRMLTDRCKRRLKPEGVYGRVGKKIWR